MWDLNHITWELARLVLAAVVGAAIGFEREAHGQAAGLRTFILISVGALQEVNLQEGEVP